jgi:hypothetical protein
MYWPAENVAIPEPSALAIHRLFYDLFLRHWIFSNAAPAAHWIFSNVAIASPLNLPVHTSLAVVMNFATHASRLL